MNLEAKRACVSLAINPHDLHEKTIQEFKYNSKPGETEKIIEMRYIHFESKRRKKLKILAEYIRNNRQNITKNDF